MISVPRPPTMPASLAAMVLLGGLALMYWSLVGLGLLRASTPDAASPSGASGVSASGSGSTPNAQVA